VVTGPWRRTIANTLQQVLAANATEEGTFDPSLQSEDVLTAIFADRGEKIDEITEWAHADVPLVSVATEYAPYGTSVKPAGNVLWGRPVYRDDIPGHALRDRRRGTPRQRELSPSGSLRSPRKLEQPGVFRCPGNGLRSRSVGLQFEASAQLCDRSKEVGYAPPFNGESVLKTEDVH
jgi:hypothetical protein